MMEIFAVHEVVLALDHINSVMDHRIVILERMKRIAVCINIKYVPPCVYICHF